MIDWKVVGVILGSLLIVGILATVALLVMCDILDNEFDLALESDCAGPDLDDDDADADAKSCDVESGA